MVHTFEVLLGKEAYQKHENEIKEVKYKKVLWDMLLAGIGVEDACRMADEIAEASMRHPYAGHMDYIDLMVEPLTKKTMEGISATLALKEIFAKMPKAKKNPGWKRPYKYHK